MKQITEVAYAKINLGLDILGRREDGYHEVSMIMQSVGLCDEITISPGSGEGKIELSTNIPGLSCGSDNLAYRAAALLAQHAGIIPNVHIALNKKIFLAAGLAGGSADAAAVLRGLNKYWQLHLENHELERLAALLGSDIPFCIEGGTMLATGRGEILTKLADLPKAIVVLVVYLVETGNDFIRTFCLAEPPLGRTDRCTAEGSYGRRRHHCQDHCGDEGCTASSRPRGRG